MTPTPEPEAAAETERYVWCCPNCGITGPVECPCDFDDDDLNDCNDWEWEP